MRVSNIVVNERVQRGATWLDRAMPEWYKGINLDKLDMESCLQCVLGQCYGSFFDALNELSPVKVRKQSDEGKTAWAARYGFTVPEPEQNQGVWDRLAMGWAGAIAYRQMRDRIKVPQAKRQG